MNERNITHALRMLVTLAVLMMPVFSSCGSDEPDWTVGYYMEIQSSTSFMASTEDEQQGTMSDHEESNVLYTTIMRMKQALRDAYPVATRQGDDGVVIAALDAVYRPYKAMYGQLERNTICVVKLYRTSMDGEIVKRSRALKSYHFGALPANVDDSNS